MYIKPRPVNDQILSPEELKKDKLAADSFEDCGLGEKALYLSSFGIPRMRYLPLTEIRRVFKRLAVSKGFFEENKLYGTLSYLVVCPKDGKEIVVRFTHEEPLDELLSVIRKKTDIPVGKP